MERAAKCPDLYQLMNLLFLVIETPKIINRSRELLRAAGQGIHLSGLQTALEFGASTPASFDPDVDGRLPGPGFLVRFSVLL